MSLPKAFYERTATIACEVRSRCYTYATLSFGTLWTQAYVLPNTVLDRSHICVEWPLDHNLVQIYMMQKHNEYYEGGAVCKRQFIILQGFS